MNVWVRGLLSRERATRGRTGELQTWLAWRRTKRTAAERVAPSYSRQTTDYNYAKLQLRTITTPSYNYEAYRRGVPRCVDDRSGSGEPSARTFQWGG
ncbi:hypothetical protein NHX12_014965 [Muraenolepis orangiensis]|uniref:Uncharacterized protein n=1 Tax=Muraenolepis orangiensis TaxID=630683 RepID=A0A9Q0I435_9TELE|nr:hypothetical protein NHX12_014965 [Muraenolepis orangiensis]